jgi:CHAT domain-containing protein
MLAWLRERPGKDSEPASGHPRLLALGDPAFDAVTPPLLGTRREVEAIARLYDQPEVLLGPDASEARLDKIAGGSLRGFDVIHLATHCVLDHQQAMRSALLVAPESSADTLASALRGAPVHDGVITAEQILRTWKLDADLVILSACETGKGRFSGGEGNLGFTQALFLAGARSVVLSLWKVDDRATALLMTRFHENLLGKRTGLDRPMPRGEALREAKAWLRALNVEEVGVAFLALERGQVRPLAPAGEPPKPALPSPRPAGQRPFEHPYYWAGFILVGDPW